MIKKINKEEDKKYLVKRLNIIGGQITGLAGMITDEREYEEVLIQLGAITNSLRTVGRKILESYIRNNSELKKPADVQEIMNLLNKLV